MNKPAVIRKVALAVFKNRKIMMVRDEDNNEVFYLPGGTLEEDESDLECLVREIKEELSTELSRKSLVLLGEFEASAHGRPNTVVSLMLFRGEIVRAPKPSGEIVEIKYFDSTVSPKHLSEIAKKHIFPWLKRHDYIN